MTSLPAAARADPRPMMADLWRRSGLSYRAVADRMGIDAADGRELEHLRRVLVGYLHPRGAEEVRGILDALGIGHGDHGRQCYVLAYLRWANFPEMVGLADQHHVSPASTTSPAAVSVARGGAGPAGGSQ